MSSHCAPMIDLTSDNECTPRAASKATVKKRKAAPQVQPGEEEKAQTNNKTPTEEMVLTGLKGTSMVSGKQKRGPKAEVTDSAADVDIILDDDEEDTPTEKGEVEKPGLKGYDEEYKDDPNFYMVCEAGDGEVHSRWFPFSPADSEKEMGPAASFPAPKRSKRQFPKKPKTSQAEATKERDMTARLQEIFQKNAAQEDKEIEALKGLIQDQKQITKTTCQIMKQLVGLVADNGMQQQPAMHLPHQQQGFMPMHLLQTNPHTEQPGLNLPEYQNNPYEPPVQQD